MSIEKIKSQLFLLKIQLVYYTINVYLCLVGKYSKYMMKNFGTEKDTFKIK